MDTKVARKTKSALEALHSMIYFVPEAEQRLGELGLQAGQESYLAGRSAPMGAVGAGVVTATFYNFNPETVAASIPHAWSVASPADVLTARFNAADAALRRLLGEHTLGDETVSEAARLAREAAEGCEPEGKPLYAAHADLGWPEAAHLQLWHAVSLLREFRGDAHIAALQNSGISGLQSMLLQNAAGEGLAESFAKASRGWSDQQWSSAQSELRNRQLLDEQGALTETGQALREEVESATDAMSMAPWRHLGADKLERLTTRGGELSHAVVKAGAFPRKAFVQS